MYVGKRYRIGLSLAFIHQKATWPLDHYICHITFDTASQLRSDLPRPSTHMPGAEDQVCGIIGHSAYGGLGTAKKPCITRNMRYEILAGTPETRECPTFALENPVHHGRSYCTKGEQKRDTCTILASSMEFGVVVIDCGAMNSIAPTICYHPGLACPGNESHK